VIDGMAGLASLSHCATGFRVEGGAVLRLPR
jgi:hypothetical protein